MGKYLCGGAKLVARRLWWHKCHLFASPGLTVFLNYYLASFTVTLRGPRLFHVLHSLICL